MKRYGYKQTYSLMRKFYELGMTEVRILDYLMENGATEITYAKLTKAIGLDPKSNSNVRNAVLGLRDMGLITIIGKNDGNEDRQGYNPMKVCALVDGWIDILFEL